MRRIALVLILTAVSTTLFAQSAPYIEQFDVRVNSVDVIVTDRAGNRVTGLVQEDFVVKEGGVVQQVTNFSEYRSERGVGVSVPSSVSRKFVFLIDEMSLHPRKRVVLKKAMQKLIASTMRDGDEAMIVRPGSPDRIPLRFTADHTLLATQLESIVDAQYFRVGTPLNADRERRVRDESLIASSDHHWIEMYAIQNATLGNILSIVSAMAEVPGKKTMVLVTEHLPSSLQLGSFAPSRRWHSSAYAVSDTLEAIARTASSNGIAIYTLQAEFGIGAAIGGPNADNSRTSATFQSNNTATEATMAVFAERTGASWSREIDKFFTALHDDLSTYYSLGYRPTTPTDNKSRRIVVAVKGRPELRVRARKDVVQKTLAEEMNERVVGHLVYPNTVDELGVRTIVGTPRRTKGNTVVELRVMVPISSLTLLREGDKYRGSFRIHYAAAGVGTFSSGAEREQIVEIAAGDIDTARTREWEYTTSVEVRNNRATDIAVGVLDPISRLTSFKTFTIDAR